VPFALESPGAVQDDIRFWNQRGRYFMQKSMRYHIADGENQPVVRAVALVPRPEAAEANPQAERAQPEPTTETRSPGKNRWIRPALRKALLASS
jgi:hypothetical protein